MEIEKYTVFEICPLCQGKRLKKEVLSVTVAEKNIWDLSQMSLEKLLSFFEKFSQDKALSEERQKISQPILKEINARLNYLIDVGLGYLTLERKSSTLAGGEAQRIRLATQIGTGLSGVLYILDEPSIGLHQRDQGRLINILKKLRDLKNSVIVVEHDRQTMEESDWIIDIGPDAGNNGGKIIAEGTPEYIKKQNTHTGRFLANKDNILREKNKIAKQKKNLEILGAKEHNLKNIDVKIPLGNFVAITGVSGSGKSTLINDILTKALFREFYHSHQKPGEHKGIRGKEFLDKIVVVDQSPIGRTPRSNPATYTGVFGPIRDAMAQTKEARIRGYRPGRFSFNVKGGRCEACQGQGLIKIEMQFLSDVYVKCEECDGTRYGKDILSINYKGKNIAEILEMTVAEAKEFFVNIPVINRKLDVLNKVGLGYIHLGQAATTLSGGEAQRIKLSKELSKIQTSRTLYVLDEPTTGLHFHDVKNLIGVLDKLVKKGNTVIVIEHNLDVIRLADWIIDLGPEGGDKGGQIIAEGTPEQIIKIKESYTGQCLNGV